MSLLADEVLAERLGDGDVGALEPLYERHSRAVFSLSLKLLAEREAAEEGERSAGRHPPTEKMIAYAQRLARDAGARLPPGFDQDFEICRRFLDAHSRRGGPAARDRPVSAQGVDQASIPVDARSVPRDGD